MLRNVDLSEISDGKLYDANDMVKADCKGCEGCSACCRGMGKSIVLENDSFRYFLQVHECPKPSKAKIKVYKWLDTDDIRTYEQFISDWHYFLKALQERIAGMEDQTQIRSICMYVLQQFYLAPCEDFYEAFHGRLDEAKRYFEM